MKKLLILSLIILVVVFFTVGDLKIIGKKGKVSDFDTFLNSLKQADVVFIGEQHTDPKAHFVEFEVFKGLYRKLNGKIILSLEMFERDVQKTLDLYLKGKISEEEFLKNSRPWKNYKTDYRPLIEFAKEHKVKVLAANVPRRYAAMVARGGLKALEQLKPEERKYISKKIYYDYPEYRKLFYKTMEEMGGPMGKHGASKFKEKFYKAQCVKDSTMAESICMTYKSNKGFLILHINGSFHSDYKLGTAAVLKTLCPELIIKNIKVLPEMKKEIKNNIADYIVY